MTIRDQDYTNIPKRESYGKKEAIPIKLIPVKTLDEWFTNLPLIHKIDLYNNFTRILAENLK